MSSALGLLAIMFAALAAYMMLCGFIGLAKQRMQLYPGGRILFGPLAQFCGILALVPLPMSLIAGGEVAYMFGFRPDPMETQRRAAEFLPFNQKAEPNAQEKQQIRAAVDQWLNNWIFEFAAFGVVCDLAVCVMVSNHGVLPRNRESTDLESEWDLPD
jgi:hypothetical protein